MNKITNKIVAIASVMLFGLVEVQAVGTLSNISISNNATISYQVAGLAQTTVTSSTDSFVVDNKVNLTVVHQDPAAVVVTPGLTKQVLTFKVTNTGNTAQDYILTAAQFTSTAPGATNPFILSDTTDVTNVTIFVESGTTSGYQAAEDTATFIDELAADGVATVYIVSDIPTATVNSDIMSLSLTAQTADGGVGGTLGAATVNDSGVADTASTVEVVFADGAGTNGASDAANDGKFGDTDAYSVVTAALVSTKTSCIISDPVNLTTNPKRIPGAIIRYGIQVTNNGTVDANLVSITDIVPNPFGTSANTLEVWDAACTGITSGVCAAKATNNLATTNTGAGTSSVTLNYGTVAAGTSKCGYFNVTIQ